MGFVSRRGAEKREAQRSVLLAAKPSPFFDSSADPQGQIMNTPSAGASSLCLYSPLRLCETHLL